MRSLPRALSTILLALGLGAVPPRATADPLELVEVPLPGRRIASTSDVPWGGSRIVVLLGPEGEEHDDAPGPSPPRTLVVVDLAAESPTVRPAAIELPGGARDLALVDLDGDGREELLVSAGDTIHALGRPHLDHSPAAPVALWHAFGASLSAVHTLAGGRPSPGLAMARAGALELLIADDRGELRRASLHRLPIDAELRPWGLRLESPPVTDLGDGRFLVGPAVHGQRLATGLVGFCGEGQGDAGATAWSRLPGEEVHQRSSVALLDDRPVLVATTLEEMGIFKKLQLRVFPLAPDASRAGRSPSFSTATDANMWYEVETFFRDLDRDGKEDLVVMHPEGMGGGDLEIASYRGRGGGHFENRGRHSKRRLDDSSYRYGDVTGDGVPDLVIGSGSHLAIYGGKAGRDAFDVVAKKPTWTLDLDDSRGARQVTVGVSAEGVSADTSELHRSGLELLDLDRDEVAEILVWGEGESHDHLTVIRTVAAAP